MCGLLFIASVVVVVIQMMCKAPEPYQPPEGFKLVYRGGHHDVYCNGTQHIWTSGGGLTQMSRAEFRSIGVCDCIFWKLLDEANQ
jgi:hypothetical protein